MEPNVIGALIYVYFCIGIIVGLMALGPYTTNPRGNVGIRALTIGLLWPIVTIAVMIKEMYHMTKEYLERF